MVGRLPLSGGRFRPVQCLDRILTLSLVAYVDPIPSTAMILEGEVTDKGHGGFTISIEKFYSEQHKELKGTGCTLFIPNSKIDHIRLLD